MAVSSRDTKPKKLKAEKIVDSHNANVVTIDALLSSNDLPRVIVILGTEKCRISKAIDHILTKNTLSVTHRLEGNRCSPAGLRDALQSLSLFTTRPVTIISHFETLKLESEKALAGILESKSLSGYLILTGEKLLKSNILRKGVEALGKIVNLEPLAGVSLKKWSAKEAREAKITLNSSAVLDHLVLYSKEDADLIKANIEYLSLLYEGEEITLPMIQQLFPAIPESQEFAILQGFTSNKPGEREIVISRVLAEGESPFQLLGLIAKSYSQCLAVRAGLDARESLVSLRQKLGVTPWVFERYLEVAKKCSRISLQSMIASIVRADSQLKNRSLGYEVILSELGFAVSTKR